MCEEEGTACAKTGRWEGEDQGETCLLRTPASSLMGKSLGFGIRQTLHNLLLVCPWARSFQHLGPQYCQP